MCDRTGARQRVLVVDDDVDTTEILTALLNALGHDTRSANSGGDAIRIAREFDPQLILLDLGLPDVTGNDVVRILRDDADGRRYYVVAVSAWCRREDIRAALASGFDEHIPKPIDVMKLREVLRVSATVQRQRA